MASTHLTKSRTMAGLQCLRRLWLLVHEPQEYEEPPAGSPLAVGHEIGRHAHRLFPGGALVAEAPWRHAEAVARTATLMADPAVPAIFEAAFTHDDIRIRVDVLERLPDGWGLREVKSSTGVKDHYLDDVGCSCTCLKKPAWLCTRPRWCTSTIPTCAGPAGWTGRRSSRGWMSAMRSQEGEATWWPGCRRCARACGKMRRPRSSRASIVMPRRAATSGTTAPQASHPTGSLSCRG